jgi:hypothetical protein
MPDSGGESSSAEVWWRISSGASGFGDSDTDASNRERNRYYGAGKGLPVANEQSRRLRLNDSGDGDEFGGSS